MNIFSKIYCRAYQITMRVFLPFLPYSEPEILANYNDLINVLYENEVNNVFLVTDKNIKNLGLTDKLIQLVQNNGKNITIYDNTNVNPTTANVEEAVKLYNERNCDCIIAFGGGSPMDCAKAVGARIACPHKSLYDMRGLLKVNHRLPLLIAIPTTAGTGSEVTLSSVITDSETHHKFTINDFDLIPSYTLLDAKLTLGLPKDITATTGMDALTHAIEAFIGKSTTNTTRKDALNSIKLIFENLETAYRDGTNLTARENMLKASHYAGLAFTKSYVGYVHAVSHSLGGKYNIPHALANAIILPYMLKMYGKSVYKKLHKIALFTGLCSETTQIEEASDLVIKKIEEMNFAMNIPTCIKEIKEEDVSFMAKVATKEANPLYPVPKLFNAKELEEIYYKIK